MLTQRPSGAGLDAFEVELHAPEKPVPIAAGSAVFEQEMGAIFIGWFLAATWPMVMRNDVFDRDPVNVSDVSGEACGFVDGEGEVIAAVFAHFDADAVVVAWAIKVGVFTLLTAGEVLDGNVFLSGEVPGEVADAVAAGAAGGAEGSAFEGEGVVVSVAGVVLSAVDGDVAGFHLAIPGAPDAAGWDQIGFEIDFTQQLSRSDRAERTVIVSALPRVIGWGRG